MKQSEIFLKTRKEAPKDEVAANVRLLIRANFIEKLMAGVYSMLPLGLRVKNNIENIIRDEMNDLGADEVFMPALHPKKVWEKTGRWSSIDELYKLKDNSGSDMTLSFTHEEVIADIVKHNVDSYTDLPLGLYQIQTKFRDEARPKSGLLRGREFKMKDLYSFHTDEDSLDEYYEKAKKVYFNIFDRVGIGDKTYLTFASGGSFSKYSHEFQTVSEVGEDTIYLCEKCDVGINAEIIDDQEVCPECGGDDFSEESSIEVGNIFKLGTKFSEPSDLTYKNEDGELNPVIMASYGIGIERLMGAVAEVFHDDQGLIWPQSVAPMKAHLLLIGEAEGDLLASAEGVYNKLAKSDIEVLFDDRDVSAGEKFADADLIGIPWRIVVSNNTLKEDKVELKARREDEEKLLDLDEVIKLIKKNE